MTELEDSIIGMLAEERGTERALIRLDSSLAQDLGMDGDDAVEFVEDFADRFNVDLAALWCHWNDHFKSEGFLPPFGCTAVIGAAIVARTLLHMAANRIPAWAAIPVLIVILAWAFRKVFNYYSDAKAPITVNDLVYAVTSGKWVKQYTDK